MDRVQLEKDYWDKAALDPDVGTKYISDISTEEMIDALDHIDVGKTLEIGCGVFRFQFIEGTEQEPFSNHYSLDEIKQWLKDAGLEFIKADKGLCHFQWTWVTAKKP